MSVIGNVQEKVQAGKFEFSKHATDQSIKRDISAEETKEAILSGEMIEDYPEDKYGPSCLIFGRTAEGRPIHVQCSYSSRPLAKIITLYEPNANRWTNFRKRR
jgi:hypothetical protein